LLFPLNFIHTDAAGTIRLAKICSGISMLFYALWYLLFFYDPALSNFPLLRKCKLPRNPFGKIVKTKVLLIESLDVYKYEENKEETQVEMTHL